MARIVSATYLSLRRQFHGNAGAGGKRADHRFEEPPS
jgi:hypothetical protein